MTRKQLRKIDIVLFSILIVLLVGVYALIGLHLAGVLEQNQLKREQRDQKRKQKRHKKR